MFSYKFSLQGVLKIMRTILAYVLLFRNIAKSSVEREYIRVVEILTITRSQYSYLYKSLLFNTHLIYIFTSPNGNYSIQGYL